MADEHLQIVDFNGNPNIGLYAYANDKFCLIGQEVSEKDLKLLKLSLDVPIHQISLAGTSLIGVFCTGNKNGIIIPNIVFDSERRKLDELNIPYTVVDTIHTALGNNVLVNDHHAMVNPELEESARLAIQEALKVPIVEMKIAGLPIVGSVAVLRNDFALAHHDIEDFEKKLIEVKMKVQITEGSVNMGSPYVRSGLILNANGFCVGSASGGPEIDHIDHALGFIE